MKKYTDGIRIVQAKPMTDVEYFRNFDCDISYPDDNPVEGMFVIFADNGLTTHFAFYQSKEKFFEKFTELAA